MAEISITCTNELSKYLGNNITEEQQDQILHGYFRGLRVGDYWTIGDNRYTISEIKDN